MLPGNNRVIRHLTRDRKLARSFDEGVVFVELIDAVGDVLQDRGVCHGRGVGASREGVAEGCQQRQRQADQSGHPTPKSLAGNHGAAWQ